MELKKKEMDGRRKSLELKRRGIGRRGNLTTLTTKEVDGKKIQRGD